MPADHRMAMRNKAHQLWHTDASFKRVPALTSILSARIIPASGGETEFASTRPAFERLDPDLRALYIASHAGGIEGMEAAAGRKLIEDLMAATAPARVTCTNGAMVTS